ncbi:peptidase S8/S53 subtilisin kexin sedolisin [Candidatus Omnitrophus magneticus]|uniref:Peptidase S8/S53 subtilisin kexin sedolisin n=1 Tax=Candidatus Omnitrophus magneticus TaxID=1609969 RepID=A0A0F0CTE9_9BACT|nr:peptidase S8/S53 subtilisin kexin sedolisin [Candidatus Omnitrophus magneticus]
MKNGEGTGLAQGSELLNLKIFDNETKETTSSLVRAALISAFEMGARIALMPFSLFPVSTELNEVIEDVVNKGMLLITSAGNEGSPVIKGSLAANDNVITAGASDQNGIPNVWSNYGSSVDFYVPSNLNVSENKKYENGTSYSAAFLAGVIADLLSKDGDIISKDDVMSRLAFACGLGAADLNNGITVNTAIEETLKVAEAVTDNIQDRVPLGADINEILSREETLNKSYAEFTGYNIVAEKDKNLK